MGGIFRLMGLLMIFFLAQGAAEESTLEEALQSIDQQVALYKSQKKKHEQNRQRHLSLAHRWQGNSELFLESKREYDLAQHLLDQIHILEQKIERLEQEKKEKQTLQKIR